MDLKNPQVEDFTYYDNRSKASLIPKNYGLLNTNFRHLKVLDLLDEDVSTL